MCGRYTIKIDTENARLREIVEEAGACVPPSLSLTLREGGDAYPTDIMPAIMGSGGAARAAKMRWGFKTESGLIINARAETALERPMFRESALERRCLLPAMGYYEWNAHREKFLFRRPDNTILYLAGLYRVGGDGVYEYVILTREADGEARAIHTRMPLVVSSVGDWLFDRAAAAQILASGGETRLEIERQSPEQLSMFDD